MFDIDPNDIRAAGYSRYFSEPPNTGYIRERIEPPRDSNSILMGCRSVNDTNLKVGVIVEAAKLFDYQSYEYDQVETAIPNKEFYTYAQSNRTGANVNYGAIGFAGEEKIYLSNIDYYDCWLTTESSSCPPEELNNHRVSAHLRKCCNM